MPENQGTDPFADDPEVQREREEELERADAAAVLDDDLDDDAEIRFVGPEAAAQRLTELTEQLGLYDDTDAAGEPRQVAYNKDTPIYSPQPPHYEQANCPFCGRANGTCRHHSGGPA